MTSTGRPFVYGELSLQGACKTILLYGYYDGVPVDPECWHSDPYDPVMRSYLPKCTEPNWDKSSFPEDGLIQTTWRVFGRSIADSKNAIIGILSVLDFFKQRGLELGVRGILQFDLTAFTANTDVHSGHFGGLVPNSVFRMAHLISSMKDIDGNIMIVSFLLLKRRMKQFKKSLKSIRKFVTNLGLLNQTILKCFYNN